MTFLDDVLTATDQGPSSVRQNDDASSINWQRGQFDIHELNGRSSVEAGLSRARIAEIDGKIAVIYTADTDAWHELGTMVDKAMSVDDLFRLCPALDFTVEKQPVYCESGAVPDAFAVVRVSKSGERKPFAGITVGNRLELVQIRESLAFLDDALGKTGAHYETAGAIEDGRKIFVSAKMPNWIEPVKGDEVHQYLALTDAYDGSETGRWFSCENRIVCKNTRRLAMEGGRDFHRFRHTASIRDKMSAAVNFRSSAKDWTRFGESADEMVKTPVDVTHFADDVLDCVLDVTQADSKLGASALAAALDVTQAERDLAYKSIKRRLNRRESILEEIIERSESERNTAPGTTWGAYNAVTEFANHGIRYKGSVRKRAETRLDSVLTGRADEINQAAYSSALATLA